MIDPGTATLLSGGATLVGGLWSNAQNLAESKRAREWSAAMAGSAYQRAMLDMKAAGLNPILAAGGMSATPGAATANVDDAVGPAVSSALQAQAQAKSLKLMDEQIARTREEVKGARADARVKSMNADTETAKYLYYFTSEGQARPALMDLLRAEYSQKMAGSARDVAGAKLAELSIPEQQALARVFQSVGGGGKGVQLLLPLLLQLLRR